MKYTVIHDFIERGSLNKIKAGDEYACLDPARAAKLIRLGYIAEKAEKPEAEKAEKPKKEDVKAPEKKTAKAQTSAKRSTKAKKA